jgi:hypothetical protein
MDLFFTSFFRPQPNDRVLGREIFDRPDRRLHLAPDVDLLEDLLQLVLDRLSADGEGVRYLIPVANDRIQILKTGFRVLA